MNRILVDENEYVEGIKRAEREAQAAAEAAIKAFNDSVTDARVRDSIILAREDSIMSLHRVKDKDAETEYVEEEFGTGGGWVFPKKNDK
jgi:flavin-dependent dehydrogenase